MRTEERYFLMDFWGVDRLTVRASARWKAEKEFYNTYGYMPDIVKIIDELGGTVETLKS
jgi:hypothetical protein